jgi:hypothetical protein
MAIDRRAAAYPEVAQWMNTTRLNPTCGIGAYRDDPIVADSRARVKQHARTAVENLGRLHAQVT